MREQIDPYWCLNEEEPINGAHLIDNIYQSCQRRRSEEILGKAGMGTLCITDSASTRVIWEISADGKSIWVPWWFGCSKPSIRNKERHRSINDLKIDAKFCTKFGIGWI